MDGIENTSIRDGIIHKTVNANTNNINNDSMTTKSSLIQIKSNNYVMEVSNVKSCEYCGNTEHDGDDCPHQIMIDDDEYEDDDDDDDT